MSDKPGEEILSEADVNFLKALIAVVPAVGDFIQALAGGEAAAQRRVADILPEKSATERARDQLLDEQG